MKDFTIKKWRVWLWIATLFVGSVMTIMVSQMGILQPSYKLGFFDCEVIFLLMIIPFLVGIGTGIYYQKGE
jgi:hypothetical protein